MAITNHARKSINWVKWSARSDLQNCKECDDRHNTLISTAYADFLWPPVHENCGCTVSAIDAYIAGTATNQGLNGADYYLMQVGILPDYYITKEEATALGWIKEAGNLNEVAPGKIIGGDIYHNKARQLPTQNGRIWYEADINYTVGYRGDARIIFSNDGLVFVSYDHYKTFCEIIDSNEILGE